MGLCRLCDMPHGWSRATTGARPLSPCFLNNRRQALPRHHKFYHRSSQPIRPPKQLHARSRVSARRHAPRKTLLSSTTKAGARPQEPDCARYSPTFAHARRGGAMQPRQVRPLNRRPLASPPLLAALILALHLFLSFASFIYASSRYF